MIDKMYNRFILLTSPVTYTNRICDPQLQNLLYKLYKLNTIELHVIEITWAIHKKMTKNKLVTEFVVSSIKY